MRGQTTMQIKTNRNRHYTIVAISLKVPGQTHLLLRTRTSVSKLRICHVNLVTKTNIWPSASFSTPVRPASNRGPDATISQIPCARHSRDSSYFRTDTQEAGLSATRAMWRRLCDPTEADLVQRLHHHRRRRTTGRSSGPLLARFGHRQFLTLLQDADRVVGAFGYDRKLVILIVLCW